MMVRGPRDTNIACYYLRSSRGCPIQPLCFFSSAIPNPRLFIVLILIYSTPGHSLQCNATETGKESICPKEDGRDTMAASLIR